MGKKARNKQSIKQREQEQPPSSIPNKEKALQATPISESPKTVEEHVAEDLKTLRQDITEFQNKCTAGLVSAEERVIVGTQLNARIDEVEQRQLDQKNQQHLNALLKEKEMLEAQKAALLEQSAVPKSNTKEATGPYWTMDRVMEEFDKRREMRNATK